MNKKTLQKLCVRLLAAAFVVTVAGAVGRGVKADSMAKYNSVEFIKKIKTGEPSDNGKGSLPESALKFADGKNIVDGIWKKDRLSFENDTFMVQTDQTGNPITFINKDKVKADVIKNKITDKKYADKSKEIAEKAVASIKGSDAQYERVEEMQNGYLTHKWARTYKGYKFLSDFMIADIDPSDGQVVTISKRFASKLPASTNVSIDKDTAIENAIKYLKNTPAKFDGFTLTKTDIMIINPNYAWIDSKEQKEVVVDSRLAYAVEFTKTSIDNTIQIIEAWIDSETGEALGLRMTN